MDPVLSRKPGGGQTLVIRSFRGNHQSLSILKDFLSFNCCGARVRRRKQLSDSKPFPPLSVLKTLKNRFGTRGSEVQILSPRPFVSNNLRRLAVPLRFRWCRFCNGENLGDRQLPLSD